MSSSISIAVTTFNRPEGCLRLLEDIAKYTEGHRVRVTVYDDCSPADYRPVQQFLRARGWQWVRARRNFGKRLWWKQVNKVLAAWLNDAADYFYFIQDDMRLCEDFFTRTIGLWEQIGNAEKVALYLLRDHGRDPLGTTCWTKFKSRLEGVVERTQWIDCNAFLCTHKFVDGLNGQLEPIPASRWAKNPTLSSGVGAQFSQRLHRKKLGLYRSLHSYVLHLDMTSQMNPEVRTKDPLRAVRFIDGPDAEKAILREYETITASLATIPSRRHTLAKVVARLLPQVDHLNIYLNETPRIPGGDGHPNLPEFLKHPKITAVWSQDTATGDRGDAGKFYWASEIPTGYHVVCDDDVIYPTNFVAGLIAGVEKYERRVAVGYHGAVLTNPFLSYYKSRKVSHFALDVRQDTPVHILASNSLCYHTSTIKVHRDDFKHPNMGDIWFGLLAQQQRVPLITLAHRANWMVDHPSTRSDSIYAHSQKKTASQKNTASVQTATCQENMPWHVRDPSGRVTYSIGDNAPPIQPRAAPARNARRAAFLTATTRRPLLLAACLKSCLEQWDVPAGWQVELLVSGPADDPGRVIAELAGARYIVAKGQYPGDKINAMLAVTDADLVMLADDDDIQSPYRAKASIDAHVGGFKWSSVGQWYVMNTTSGKATVWKGPPELVGTTISVSTAAAKKAGGWPAVPSGKDGLFQGRMKNIPIKDVTDICGMTTVQLQHGVNIHRGRPFPDKAKKTRRGRYDVYGKGYYSEVTATLPEHIGRLLDALMTNTTSVETCSLCGYRGVYGTYRGRPNEQCPVCGALRRHRRQALWLRNEGVVGPTLHLAPEPSLAALLRKLGHYTSMDIRRELKTDVVGDLRDMTFPDQRFGLVVVSHVLEHIVEVDKAISECFRVLRPGGYALLDVPYFDRPKTKSIPLDAQGHVWEPGKDWADRYKATGFTVVRTHPSGTVLCRRDA